MIKFHQVQNFKTSMLNPHRIIFAGFTKPALQSKRIRVY